MKVFHALIVLSLATCQLNAATFTRSMQGGDWSNVNFWRDNASGDYVKSAYLPRDGDIAVINGNRTISLDVDTAVDRLYVTNGTSDGTLVLDQPYSLRAKSINVGSENTDGQGLISITKGALDVDGSLSVNRNSRVVIDGGILGNMYSGESRRFAGEGTIELKEGRLSMIAEGAGDKVTFDNALTIVSGGVLQAQQTLLGCQAEAELRVVGDASMIQFKSINQKVGAGAMGTFRFVLGEAGVSVIDVDTYMHLESAKLIVDGSSYRGGSKVFPLFKSKNLASSLKSENIVVTGLGKKGMGWRLIQDTEDSEDVLLEVYRN